MTNKLLLTSALLASTSGAALAEGLERSNLSSFFLFEEGTYVEAAIGNVNTSLPAVAAAGLGGTPFGDVAGDFKVVNFAAKTQVSDNFSLGISYSSSGNGVNIDWGTVVAPEVAADFVTGDLTPTGGFGLAPISADVRFPTIAVMGKFKVSERFSLIGGIKRVSITGGTLSAPIGVLTITGLTTGDILPTAASWAHTGTAQGFGGIVGVGYEIPAIALRAVLTYESEIDIAANVVDTTGGTGVSADGVMRATIGDALNLQFQTGIAQNTLLFGNIRYSMWDGDDVIVPLAPGLYAPGSETLTDFENGYSISLGVARRINEMLAVSVSGFYDPGDGIGASELSPQGANKSLTAGARFSLENGANIDVGVTYSKRGDAVTGGIGATLNDSKVISAGVKVSKSF